MENPRSISLPNRVFTEEVEYKLIRWIESNMFVAQRATANGVGFVFTLLVTCSQSELVDEVHRGRALPVRSDLRLKLGRIILPNALDVFLGK